MLLPALPPTLRTPVFIVLHIPRMHPSLLVELFAPRCRRPVREADDKTVIEAGTVYFAPPDYHLLVDAGPLLALSADEPEHYSRPSIDVLFESAADVYATRLLGIILTGASQDGAAGLAAVRRAGGVTVVQRPDDAQVPFMTQAALQQGAPDMVLTLSEIADLLAELGAGRSRT